MLRRIKEEVTEQCKRQFAYLTRDNNNERSNEKENTSNSSKAMTAKTGNKSVLRGTDDGDNIRKNIVDISQQKGCRGKIW